jgi:hypothetical protein
MAGELKRLGCCTVCDVEIFDVTVRWTEGPYKGEAKQLGRPKLGARRLTLVRASGSQSNWSLCKDCEVHPLDFPRLNRKELAAMAKERNVARDTPAQMKIREKMLRLFEFDVPIGVLGEVPWLEVR